MPLNSQPPLSYPPPGFGGAGQNSLAVALKNQGSRSEGRAGKKLLAQAVTAYREALEVRTRADHPVDWTTTQVCIARALGAKATNDNTTAPRADLQNALSAVGDALAVFDPIHMSYNHTTATRLRDQILTALSALD